MLNTAEAMKNLSQRSINSDIINIPRSKAQVLQVAGRKYIVLTGMDYDVQV